MGVGKVPEEVEGGHKRSLRVTMTTLRAALTGLDISARPLAQASVKSVGRVQITDHSPVWRVRFFIAKKLIKLQNKRCFLYSVLPRNL